MIRLRALGPPDLTGDGDEQVQSVTAQPKRLALLVYLATAEPQGFRRRDELLALFWPESDDHHARAALRKSLHYLRRSLGIDALPGRGDEVGVDPDRVWSDVGAFRTALEDGRALEALDLYQGDFLEGFHADECPGFERWMDAERVRLRRKATEAALLAAESRAAAGEAREAEDLARRASELSPFDETAHRRVLELLHQIGDDAGALRIHERFARRIADELGTTPSPRTEALVDLIRRGLGLDVDKPGPREQRTRDPEPVVPPTPPPGPERRWPARLRMAAIGLVIVFGWSVGVDRSWEPGGGAAPEVNDNLIVVVPAIVEGSGESDFLGMATTRLLASALDGAGELTTVDPLAVAVFMAREPQALLTTSAGRSAAAYFGAGRFVLPRVVEADGRIRVLATLYGADEEPKAAADALPGDQQQLFEMVEDVARKLLAETAGRAGDRLTETGSVTTRSLPALKAFLQGESILRSGFAEPEVAPAAVAEYRRAVEEDSTFALAYFRMAFLDMSVPVSLDVGDAMDRALQYSDRLGPRDRWLLQCFVAQSRGYGREAENRCRRVLGSDPTNADAWYLLADALQHLGLRRGRPIAEVRDAYDRALARRESHLRWLLLHHRSWLALVEEDFSGAIHYLDLARGSRPDGVVDRFDRALVAAFRGDEGARARLFAALRETSSPWILYYSGLYTWPLDDPELTIEVLRGITAPHRDKVTQALGHRVIAHEELAAGRVEAARGELAQATSIEPESVVSQGYLLLSPYLDVSPEALMKARDDLARWNPNEVPDQIWRLYGMGLLAERLGDVAEAERCASELDEYADGPIAGDERRPPPVLADDLALYLRARLAFREGRNDDAWTLLAQTDPERWWTSMSPLAHQKQLYERWLTAEVLVALGRHQEALHWLAGIGMEGERAYMGIRHFRMAEIYEELGDTVEAVDHYRRFVRHWRDPDTELWWRVDAARRRLEALAPS